SQTCRKLMPEITNFAIAKRGQVPSSRENPNSKNGAGAGDRTDGRCQMGDGKHPTTNQGSTESRPTGEVPPAGARAGTSRRNVPPSKVRYEPGRVYYFACVRCGTRLDRSGKGFEWVHRRPEQEQLRNWSFRISQFGIPAIEVSQIVADWARAV